MVSKTMIRLMIDRKCAFRHVVMLVVSERRDAFFDLKNPDHKTHTYNHRFFALTSPWI